MTHEPGMNRRSFVKTTAAAFFAATPLGRAAAQATPAAIRNQRDTMRYAPLGRSGITASRLIFGGGAALSRGRVGADRLLARAFEAGINYYDLGYDDFYKGAERNFAPFLKAHRDEIWAISKAMLPVPENHTPGTPFSAADARRLAQHWTDKLEGSLKELGQEYIDAYYIMGANSAELIRCEAIHEAFRAAKDAGKVGRLGFSSHKNAQACLAAAAETGWYDLAMTAITPAGWYDWDAKGLLEGTPPLSELQPALQQARDAGIGLIGMKAARFLTSRGTEPTVFDRFYSAADLATGLSHFQRAYAYVLAHGYDAVNSDMQNLQHLEQNIVAATA